MVLNIYIKSLIIIILVVIVSKIIILMYLEKNDEASMKLNREIENFTNVYENREEEGKEEQEEEKNYEPFIKQEGFTPIIEGLDIGKQIRNAFMKPFKNLINFFNELMEAFKSIPKRIDRFNRAFKLSFEGIELEFVNLGKSLKLGFTDVFNVIGVAGTCTINFFMNFRTCILWYILDWIGRTIYVIFVELPVFFINYIFGINLQPMVDTVNCYLEDLDKTFFNLTCNHLFHFPKWVNDLCFTCSIQQSVDDLNRDFKTTIPGLLNEPGQKFANAKDNFNKTFGASRDL